MYLLNSYIALFQNGKEMISVNYELRTTLKTEHVLMCMYKVHKVEICIPAQCVVC